MVDVDCSVCGKSFYAEPTRVSNSKSGKLFCSIKCYALYLQSRGHGGEFECATCGKPTSVTLQQIKNNKSGNFFCSKKCYGKYIAKTRSAKKTVLCDFCGKQITRSPSAIKKRNFCSKKCSDKSKKVGSYIVNGYKYILIGDEYVAEHRYIMEQFTGNTIPEGCDVHHINENTLDNRIENLAIVSHGAHVSLHRRKRWLQKVDMEFAKRLRANGLSVTSIAKMLGCSRHTLAKRFRELGIYTGRIKVSHH